MESTTEKPSGLRSWLGTATGASPTRVVITGMEIPFWDIVKLQVKVIIASLPALFTVGAIAAFLVGVFRR